MSPNIFDITVALKKMLWINGYGGRNKEFGTSHLSIYIDIYQHRYIYI